MVSLMVYGLWGYSTGNFLLTTSLRNLQMVGTYPLASVPEIYLGSFWCKNVKKLPYERRAGWFTTHVALPFLRTFKFFLNDHFLSDENLFENLFIRHVGFTLLMK